MGRNMLIVNRDIFIFLERKLSETFGNMRVVGNCQTTFYNKPQVNSV